MTMMRMMTIRIQIQQMLTIHPLTGEVTGVEGIDSTILIPLLDFVDGTDMVGSHRLSIGPPHIDRPYVDGTTSRRG